MKGAVCNAEMFLNHKLSYEQKCFREDYVFAILSLGGFGFILCFRVLFQLFLPRNDPPARAHKVCVVLTVEVALIGRKVTGKVESTNL